MRLLLRMLSSADCVRVGKIWTFAVIAAVVFTVAEARLMRVAAVVGAFLVLAWWAGLVSVVVVTGGVVRRLSLPWHVLATVFVVVAAVAVGWGTLAAFANLLGVQDIGYDIWLASIDWIPGSMLTILALMAGEAHLRLALREREDLIARIDRVQREYEAAETARLRIAMLVDETKGDVARALADPIADVATVVTPLSDHAREVSHRVHAIAPDTNGARGDRWAWLPVWLDDLAYAPHWPVIAGFTFVYIVIAPRLFIISLRDGFVLTAVTVVCGAVAWLVARVLRPAVPSFPTPLRRASLLLLFAVTLTPVAFVMFLPTMSGVQLLVSAVATVPLATLGAVVPTTMATDVARRDAQQRDLQSRLAVVSCKAEVAAAELRQAQAQARTELHGSVQGRAQAAIAAAALSARGVNDAEPVAEEALRALAEWANTAQPEHPLEGADPIDCAIRPWDGVLTVDASIAGDIDWAHRLRAAECIQDALVNAVRHGRATAVTVDVATTSKGIDIVVTDNGVGPGAITPGLGLCRIEEAGGTWSLTPGAEGGARLVVRLPEPLNREPLNRER